jgi:hypothetical protein
VREARRPCCVSGHIGHGALAKGRRDGSRPTFLKRIMDDELLLILVPADVEKPCIKRAKPGGGAAGGGPSTRGVYRLLCGRAPWLQMYDQC